MPRFTLGSIRSLFLLIPAGALAAQTTWIVDQNGTPPFNFTDLPPAEAAAQDGDTILVRAGTYTGISTGKALTLLGESRARINPISYATFVVTGLPLGKSFVLRGFDFIDLNGPSRAHLQLRSNAGSIHIDRTTVTNRRWGVNPTTWFPVPGIEIEDCAHVTINECTLNGWPNGGLYIKDRSRVIATNCVVWGIDRRDDGRTGQCVGGGPAITIADSSLWLAGGSVTGGQSDCCCFPVSSGFPAIVATNAVVTIGGDSTTSIAAGALIAPQYNPAQPAIFGAGTLLLDPDVALVANAGAPQIAGGIAATTGELVSQLATGAPPGGALTSTTISPQGDLVWQFVGLPSPPVPTSLGELGLLPAGIAVLSSGTQGPTERYTTSVTLPSSPALRGFALGLQSVSGQVGRFALSNPAVVSLH